MSTDEMKERIQEVRKRAVMKYQNVLPGEPITEPCPGCGCAPFAAARQDVDALIAEIERQTAEVAELRDIVDALADTGKCHYDHHGYCQEHLWFKSDVECPHARAQRLWDVNGNELPAVTDLAQHGKKGGGGGWLTIAKS